MLSMEDILEELVGDIMDEHDDMEEEPMKMLSDTVCQFEGTYLIEDAYECLGLPEIEYEESTIGGYVFGLLGREEDKYIPWDAISRFGEDIILVARGRAE